MDEFQVLVDMKNDTRRLKYILHTDLDEGIDNFGDIILSENDETVFVIQLRSDLDKLKIDFSEKYQGRYWYDFAISFLNNETDYSTSLYEIANNLIQDEYAFSMYIYSCDENICFYIIDEYLYYNDNYEKVSLFDFPNIALSDCLIDNIKYTKMVVLDGKIEVSEKGIRVIKKK